MKTHIPFGNAAGALVLAGAFGFAAYRAFVQPIAHDEALTFVWFLNGGVAKTLQYNGNNHVLFTLMAKVFVKLFGPNEFSLRSPSLIGAGAYFLALYFLCIKLFGNSLLFVLAVAMLSLNPQVMDFTVAARGYGLGIASLCWAAYLMIKILEDDNTQLRLQCFVAAIFLALAVASNLTNMVAVFGLTLSFYVVAANRNPKVGNPADSPHKIVIIRLVMPAVTSALFILWPFLIQARPSHFGFGLHTIGQFLHDVFNASMLYRWTGDIYSPSLGAVPVTTNSWQGRVSDWGAYAFLPAVFLFAVWLFLTSRSNQAANREEIHGRFFAGAAVSSVVLTFCLHAMVGADYPPSRACLPLIFFFTIVGTLGARKFALRFTGHEFRFIGYLVAISIVCNYLSSIHSDFFRYNAYDSISRSLFLSISNDAMSHKLSGVRVGGTWWYQPEVDFYRVRYKADWMHPFDIKDASATWQSPGALDPRDYDYFVFTPTNDPHVLGRVVFRNENPSVTVIALATDLPR